MKHAIVILAMFSGCAVSHAATVTGDLRDLGNVALNTPVSFVPESNLQIIGSTLNAGVTKTVTPTNGIISTNIVGGIYTIRIPPYQIAHVSISTNAITQDLTTLLSGLANASPYTNNPNFKVRLTSADTIPAFLMDKLIFTGAGVSSVVTNNPGTNETLTVTITGGGGATNGQTGAQVTNIVAGLTGTAASNFVSLVVLQGSNFLTAPNVGPSGSNFITPAVLATSNFLIAASVGPSGSNFTTLPLVRTDIAGSNYVRTVVEGSTAAAISAAGQLSVNTNFATVAGTRTDIAGSNYVRTVSQNSSDAAISAAGSLNVRTNFAANTSPVIGGTTELAGLTNSGAVNMLGALTNWPGLMYFVTAPPGSGSNLVYDASTKGVRLATVSGGAGSQTPLTADVNGAGWSITNLNQVTSTNQHLANFTGNGTNTQYGLMSSNNLAATTNSASLQQSPPAIGLRGQVYKDSATPGSVPFGWDIRSVGVEGSTPTSTLFFTSWINGTPSDAFRFTSAGTVTSSGAINAPDAVFSGTLSVAQLRAGSSGALRITDTSSATVFSNVVFGSASATWPAFRRWNAGLQLVGGDMVSSGTNDFSLGGILAATNGIVTTTQFFTTAGTAVNWTSNNLYAGVVKLSTGNQNYYITNAAITANACVVACINSDDATATSVKAIPTSGLLQLKTVAATTGNTTISWHIVSP